MQFIVSPEEPRTTECVVDPANMCVVLSHSGKLHDVLNHGRTPAQTTRDDEELTGYELAPDQLPDFTTYIQIYIY